jgi:hypothetical protein
VQLRLRQSKQTPPPPQDAQTPPPMPPRQPPFPQLPPRNSGLKRQSTRCDTHESFSSAQDFPFQSQPPNITQPPNIMPMPAMLPPQSLLIPPDHCNTSLVSTRTWPCLFPPVYPYRLDTMPSPGSDSGPPRYEPADISGGIHANVWPTYNKISQELDKKKLEKWNKDLDVLLIFMSLVPGGGPRVQLD